MQVHVRHVADMHFKGVRGIQTVMDISTWPTHNRTFPQHPPSAKGRTCRAGTGLQYIVRKRPCEDPRLAHLQTEQPMLYAMSSDSVVQPSDESQGSGSEQSS